MRLRVAARKSDLARWQAQQVARVLAQSPARAQIEFQFKESMGDQNLDLPLSSMGQKGVFTEDFFDDLRAGRADIVVHSWKDLPVEPRAGTVIAMTLPRADVRDILLVPEEAWDRALTDRRLQVLTSSPRRRYNLSRLLPKLLPGGIEVMFAPVRGNVPTRLRRMREQGAGLVLAKAGLDRLLVAEAEGFLRDGASVRALIENCRFQVLPVSANPPAPAQGALAVEAAAGSQDLLTLLKGLNDRETFSSVCREREILALHGGGCHQKIGAAVLPRSYGTVLAVRGLTDAGLELNEWRIESAVPWTRAQSPDAVFPRTASDNRWFKRSSRPVDLEDFKCQRAWLVARAEAWPPGFLPGQSQIIWAAGVKTWQRLAAKGVWVSGCQDGLGEREATHLDALCGPLTWRKLTHSRAARDGDLATYGLETRLDHPDLRGKTHFFWMSGTSFDRARELFPEEIVNGHHAAGPGQTLDHLLSAPGLKNQVRAMAGLEQFLAETLP